MQQIETKTAATGVERRRVESVVETLATLQSKGESLAEIAHDARNMVTALGLYCDLLDEAGVLAPAFTHYSGELRLVAAASRRLVEKLVAFDDPAAVQPSFWRSDAPDIESWPARLPGAPSAGNNSRRDVTPSGLVVNLAAELLATRNLLAALAGPSVALTVDAEGGALPARITGEDLTRVLVNLVKNAVEAMPKGGRIQIMLRERALGEEAADEKPQHGPDLHERKGTDGRCLVLAVEDNGPGIPADALKKVFEPGYTSHASRTAPMGNRAAGHRGLGLAISRSIVEAAGGRIGVENRALGGARIVIELPAERGSSRSSS